MSDQIQPERMTQAADNRIQPRRDFPPPRPRPQGTLGDRVFARRDFDFWHPGTIDALSSMGVTVLFDDMDEIALDPDDTMVLDVRVDDLVFVRVGRGLLGGHPARVKKVLHEAAEVEFLTTLGEGFVNTYLFSDFRIYGESVAMPWQRGDRVIAYLPIAFNPPMPLWFPGVVYEAHRSLVEIDFASGEQALVPTTLVQPLELQPGMSVHSATEHWTTGTKYYPCRVVEQQGDEVLVEDDAGGTFNSHLSMIGVFPKGYHFEDGKLIPDAQWAARLAERDRAYLQATGPQDRQQPNEKRNAP